ncbi:fibrobacter succinogenes major paralogous domain-containing protein [Fibrobacter sp. UWB5]|uniref:fibrobacter succinogenes major paralogous domain-containing protein n=1 Tax=Fibrobacter sp. UWB5 TaxID=1964360 RepID=UPI000B52443A|nr:fibrobacter succinogenes major paralogous domain-containing protein [Fibrobacter sp. UWB5]OWV11434.1 hypothetical protein B7989_10390 [Fibrobacter sp. UWB5]
MNLFYKSLVGASILSLVACGDDSASSNSKNNEKKGLPSEVSTFVDLSHYECDEELEGVSVHVKSAEIDYVCNGDGWFRADDPASEVRYSEKNGNSKDPEKTDSTDVTDPEEEPEDTENTFTDARDGQVYKMVEIGSQVWMAQNLNYDYQVDGASYGSYCYLNQGSNCYLYGRLYTWAAAMDSAAVFSEDGKGCGNDAACSLPERVRGVCPEGWHLPSTLEWDTLLTFVGKTAEGYLALKSTSGWSNGRNGTDSTGFSMKPAGYRDTQNANDSSPFANKTAGFSGLKDVARFWVSSGPYDDNEIAKSDLQFEVNFTSEEWDDDGFADEGIGFTARRFANSVRCVKD